MRISDEVVGDITIITLSGDEDTKSDENLTRVFRQSLDAKRFNILLDLERLKYLGSRMLRIILSHTKEALNAGGKVKLLSPQPHVKNYLRESKIIDFFEIYNTRQLALESFKSDATLNASVSAPSSNATHPVSAAAMRASSPDRIDRIENQLIGLVSILREKGLLSEEEEERLFP